MSEVFNFQKLYRAYLDCRATKRKTVNALKFEWQMETALGSLLRSLQTRSYVPGRSTCFVVTNPTVREIFAADFRDRVVHHLLVSEIIKIGERMFIHDSYACRQGKGTHKAVARLQEFIKQATENGQKNYWYAQIDISGFFMSIDQNILYKIFEKLILRQAKSAKWQDEMLWLVRVVIFHNPTECYVKKGQHRLFKLLPPRKSLFGAAEGKGLPIGNYSSQFSANLYMNVLDHFIKRELKCCYYVRYVDDLVIFGENRQRLEAVVEKTEVFLSDSLKMVLNHKKTQIASLNRGIDFLGYFIKPNYILVRKRVVKKFKAKLNGVTVESLPMINSYFGHLKRANSYNLRKDIFDNHLGELKQKFAPIGRFMALQAVG